MLISAFSALSVLVQEENLLASQHQVGPCYTDASSILRAASEVLPQELIGPRCCTLGACCLAMRFSVALRVAIQPGAGTVGG